MLNTFRRIQLLHLFAHFLFVFAIFVGDANDWLWALAVYFFLQVFGVGIGLHRLFSHRSFETSPFIEGMLAFISIFTVLGSPIAWAGVHRRHHQAADQQEDPHGPRQHGYLRILTSQWYKDLRVPPKLVKDLLSQPLHKFIHANYFVILFLWITFLSLISFKSLIFFFGVPCVLVMHAVNFGLILNHGHGYRNFATADQSTNNFWVSFYTLGEGWHNNHHQDPSNWNQSHRWWEFDVPALMIRLLAKRNAEPIRSPIS